MIGLISSDDFEHAISMEKEEIDSELVEEELELELLGKVAEVQNENQSIAGILEQMVSQVYKREQFI